MTKAEIKVEVERRRQAELAQPYGHIGSDRKARRRIREMLDLQIKRGQWPSEQPHS